MSDAPFLLRDTCDPQKPKDAAGVETTNQMMPSEAGDVTYSNVGIAIICNNKPPSFDGLYHPFVVIRGMVYSCYTSINRMMTPKVLLILVSKVGWL